MEKRSTELSAALMEKTRLVESLQKRFDTMDFPAPMSPPSEASSPSGSARTTESGRRRASRRTSFQDDFKEMTLQPKTTSNIKRRDKVVLALSDAKLRKACATGLRETNVESVVPTDGKEAWELIKSGQANSLVFDVDFDDGNAKQLLGWLALSKRKFPVVVVCDPSYPTNQLPRLSQMKVLLAPVPAHQICQAITSRLGK